MDRERYDGLIILTGVSATIGVGDYRHGRQIGVQSVSDALGNISMIIEIGRLVISIYREPGKYIFSLKRLIAVYRRGDPPPTIQLVVPVSVAEYMLITGNCKNSNARGQAIDELALIVFYFILRVGEYTSTELSKTKTSTIQFTVGYISFWKYGLLLRNSDSLKIRSAKESTMHLSKQKKIVTKTA